MKVYPSEEAIPDKEKIQQEIQKNRNLYNNKEQRLQTSDNFPPHVGGYLIYLKINQRNQKSRHEN